VIVFENLRDAMASRNSRFNLCTPIIMDLPANFQAIIR
jgi:hypothetical protein